MRFVVVLTQISNRGCALSQKSNWGGLLLGFMVRVGCCWGFVGGGWLCVCGDGEWWAVRVIRRRERGERV